MRRPARARGARWGGRRPASPPSSSTAEMRNRRGAAERGASRLRGGRPLVELDPRIDLKLRQPRVLNAGLLRRAASPRQLRLERVGSGHEGVESSTGKHGASAAAAALGSAVSRRPSIIARAPAAHPRAYAAASALRAPATSASLPRGLDVAAAKLPPRRRRFGAPRRGPSARSRRSHLSLRSTRARSCSRPPARGPPSRPRALLRVHDDALEPSSPKNLRRRERRAQGRFTRPTASCRTASPPLVNVPNDACSTAVYRLTLGSPFSTIASSFRAR